MKFNEIRREAGTATDFHLIYSDPSTIHIEKGFELSEKY